jgi:hypothetical protein
VSDADDDDVGGDVSSSMMEVIRTGARVLRKYKRANSWIMKKLGV